MNHLCHKPYICVCASETCVCVHLLVGICFDGSHVGGSGFFCRFYCLWTLYFIFFVCCCPLLLCIHAQSCHSLDSFNQMHLPFQNIMIVYISFAWKRKRHTQTTAKQNKNQHRDSFSVQISICSIVLMNFLCCCCMAIFFWKITFCCCCFYMAHWRFQLQYHDQMAMWPNDKVQLLSDFESCKSLQTHKRQTEKEEVLLRSESIRGQSIQMLTILITNELPGICCFCHRCCFRLFNKIAHKRILTGFNRHIWHLYV